MRKIKGSKFWHIYYYCYGRQFRESSKSESKIDAERLLQQRLTELGLGWQPEQKSDKLKYEDIRQLLLDDYRLKKRSSLVVLEDGTETVHGLDPLDSFFGGRRVLSITSEVLRAFVRERKKQAPGEIRVTDATVNRNLAMLHRMLSLAWREGKICSIPYFPMLPEKAPEKDFVDRDQFKSLYDELPERLRPIVTFLYRTGCTFGEAKAIRLNDVELNARTVQVGKGEPRVIPLDGQDELVAEIRRKLDRYETDEEDDRLFCVKNFRKAWQRACIRSSLGRMESMPGGREAYRGLLVRDLRRSALRNMIEKGDSEKVAMAISGHKTRKVFDRFNIVSMNQLREALKRVGDKVRDDG